jgi:hypothetical protein
VAPNKDMIEAFVDGRLSADDHELMVHHISSCTECAAAVIAALAEAARALTTEVNERSAPAWVAADLTNGDATPAPAADLHQLDLILDSASAHTSSLLLRPEQVREVELDSLPAFHPPRRQPAVLHVDGVASTPGDVPLPVPPEEATLEPQAVTDLEVELEPYAQAAADEAELIADSGAAPAEHVPVDSEVTAVAAAAVAGGPEEQAVAGVVTDPGVEAVAGVEAAPVEAASEMAESPVVEVVSEAETVIAAHDAALEQADTEMIASATAARVADSAAHGAAVLAAEVSELEESEELESEERESEEQSDEQDGVELLVADEPSAVMSEVAVPVTIVPEAPSPPADVPAPPLEDRIPDSERAAIAAAVRRNTEDAVAPRSRWAGVVATVAALLIFTGLAAYGAMQLRSFASMERSPEPATHIASAEVVVPSSVLEPVFDGAAFGGVLDFPPPDSVDAPGEDATGSGTEEATQGGVAAMPDAGQPAAAAAPRPAGTRGRTGVTGTGGTTPRSTGIVPESAAAARLLRTTTHRVRPDVDYVLREYDAAAPAPSPREGVSEYRWSDAATSRLYVLSGPVAVAELRSYARRLQNGGQR